MTNFPSSLDDDSTIIRVDDNITQIGGLAINQLRSALFAVELELGIGGSGSSGSVAARLGVHANPDGTLKPSSIVAAGAICGPITDGYVSSVAAIQETKIALTFSTQSLHDLIVGVRTDLNSALTLVTNLSTDFIKHLAGVNPLSSAINSRHVVSQIDMNSEPSDTRDSGFNWTAGFAPRDRFGNTRGTSLSLFLQSLNLDLVKHEKADGRVHLDGSADQYSHVASSVSLDTSGFLIIPQTVADVQELSNYIDKTSFAGLTNHQQNHHANGIPRTCRGSILSADGYGSPVVPYTLVTTYLLDGYSSSFVDDTSDGDDIIEFVPPPDATFVFDSQFSKVKPGQIITVNYGTVQTSFVIDSARYTYDNATPPNRKYIVRINGKNLIRCAGPSVARIDQPLFTDNKFGVLSLSAVNNAFGVDGSLLIGNAKGASSLGLGFNPSALDANHYNLYLEVYHTGDPTAKALQLPPIDVTGNLGATPGKYTLQSVVDATNAAFRAPGFNYRFSAFSTNGEFGIMLADAVNNASFSICNGSYSTLGVLIPGSFTQNVIGDAVDGLDPLGFGLANANLGSTPYRSTYATIAQAQFSTKVFSPLKNKSFYVNGIERLQLKTMTDGYIDANGDGSWPATLAVRTVIPGVTVKVKYVVAQDLSKNDLRPGKTIVIQPTLPFTDSRYNDFDYGRFTIDSVTFTQCVGLVQSTTIEVYNGVYGAGTPLAAGNINVPVNLYFCDDSVGIDKLNVVNVTTSDTFKRFLEVLIDGTSHSFTHERARFDLVTSGVDMSKINIVNISPKLRGYAGATNNTINLHMNNYNTTTGIFDGYLGKTSVLNLGPTTTGQKGKVTRFYDETNVDYIDVLFNLDDTIASFTGTNLAIDIFPSLQLDQELFYIGCCILNDSNNKISYVSDHRTFGNVSEKELTTSAINFINAGEKFSHQNGVVRGFDPANVPGIPLGTLGFNGGLALVNGKFIDFNNFILTIPTVNDIGSGVSPAYAICANDSGEIQLMPLTDYIPSFGNPNNPGRLLQLVNPANSLSYYVDSETFTNIVNHRKDLTILYVVEPSGGTYPIFDARKFINSTDANTDLCWTSDNGTGHFSNLAALTTWLNFNTTFNNTVKVKGTFSISSPILLDYPNLVRFKGDGAVFNVSSFQGFTFGSNVSLEGIRFNYTRVVNPGVGDDAGYNTTNLVNSTGGLLYCAVTTNSNITVKNCEFSTSQSDHYPFISFEFPLQTAFAQHIKIQDNKFLFNGTGNDYRAAVSFINKFNDTPLLTHEGVRLVDCLIENNSGDNNQMFIISGESLFGFNIVNNTLTTVNTHIRNNVIGTISTLTRADTARNYANTNGLVHDKNYGLTISGNTCRYITCTDHTGKFLNAGPVRSSCQAGSTLITGNTCSWIHSFAFMSSSNPEDKRTRWAVNNNSLNAYDATYLDIYAVGVVSTAIMLLRGASSVSIDAMISNNVISPGKNVNASNVNSIYNYIVGISTDHDAIISNNIVNGLAADPSADFIRFSSITVTGSSTVIGNKFNRGANTIRSYINGNNGQGVHMITDNFFDQFTIDGSNTTLVINLSPRCIYERNKNQTGYSIIPLFDSEHVFLLATVSDTPTFITDGTNYTVQQDGLSSVNTTLLDVNTAPGVSQYSKLINLNKSLPNNVTILEAKIGAYLVGNLHSALDSTITLRLSSSKIPDDVLDVHTTWAASVDTSSDDTVIGTLSANGLGGGSLASQATFRAATQYATVTTTNPQYYVTGNSRSLNLRFETRYQHLGTNVSFSYSPIKITYRW